MFRDSRDLLAHRATCAAPCRCLRTPPYDEVHDGPASGRWVIASEDIVSLRGSLAAGRTTHASTTRTLVRNALSATRPVRRTSRLLHRVADDPEHGGRGDDGGEWTQYRHT